jgi:hypothetical protein
LIHEDLAHEIDSISVDIFEEFLPKPEKKTKPFKDARFLKLLVRKEIMPKI